MEQLVEIWQKASTDESMMDREYQNEDVVPHIMKLEKKQHKLLSQKTLAALIALSALIIIFLNSGAFSLYSFLGIGIFMVSTIVVIFLLNRMRFRISYEERSLPTLVLADIAERKIKTEKKIFTLYLPLFLLVALVGFNLMNLDFFREEEIETRLLYHLAMTVGVAVFFFIGLSVRIRRFRKQFLPLMELIRKFKLEAS